MSSSEDPSSKLNSVSSCAGEESNTFDEIGVWTHFGDRVDIDERGCCVPV